MITPSYIDDATDATASRIDALVPQRHRFDPNGVAQFFSPCPSASATCFTGVSRRWNPFTASPQPVPRDAIDVLRAAVAHAVDGAQRPVVALSGGLDSVAIALLLRDVLGHTPAAATLVTGLEGYCERDATVRAAELLGIELVEIHVNGNDIVNELPDAVRAAEVPMYNLHPVTKWLFAQRIATLGFDRVVTGDGADQVISHDPGVDYLPVVASMFAASDADVRWPFLDPAVIEVSCASTPDPGKGALRSFVADRLGPDVASIPKRPGFTPPLDLSRYIDTAAVERLALDVGIAAPDFAALNMDSSDDRTLTRWVTLLLLAESHC